MGLSPGTNHSGRRALCFYQTQRLREEAESQRSERDFEPFLRSSSPSFLLPSFLTPLFSLIPFHLCSFPSSYVCGGHSFTSLLFDLWLN